MEQFELYNIVLLLFGIFIGIGVYQVAGSENKTKNKLSILRLSIVLSLLAILSYYLYLEKSINNIVQSIGTKQMDLVSKTSDDIDVKMLRDSLLGYKKELETINRKLNKYSNLIDVKDKQSVLNNTIHLLNTQIERIDSYNEVLSKSDFGFSRKGEILSGETSSLVLYPPNNFNSSYLDFALRFINDSMVNNIACIYVEILQKNHDGSLTQLWEEYYRPRKGYNKVRVMNYLKKKNTEMRIGYFWKNDFGKNNYPKFEYIRFSLN